MIFIKLGARYQATSAIILLLFLLFSITVVAVSISASSETEIQDEQTELSAENTEETKPETQEQRNEDTEESNTEASDSQPVTESPVTETTTQKAYTQYYTEQDAIDLAKVLYRECGGVSSMTEQACVAWTVLNRVDCYGSSVYDVVRAPNQFAFYENTVVYDDMLKLAYDVLERWNNEKNGIEDSGRVLPKDYTYFEGHDGHNFFRNSYSYPYDVWDYSLNSPYEN